LRYCLIWAFNRNLLVLLLSSCTAFDPNRKGHGLRLRTVPGEDVPRDNLYTEIIGRRLLLNET